MTLNGADHAQKLLRKENLPKRSSCWQAWLKLCVRLNLLLENCFTRIGLFVYNHPRPVIIISVTLTLLLSAGFARIRPVTRVEELYIPQNSVSMKDIERANKNFVVKLKTEELIVKPKDGWALTEKLFKAALKIHFDILNLDGLEDICLKNALGGCHSTNPLEIFQFNNTLVSNVSEKLSYVYQNNDILLSDGGPAADQYSSMFANFEYDDQKKKISRADALRVVYFIRFPEDLAEHNENQKWELEYTDYMKGMKETLLKEDLQLMYTSGRSLDDSVSESSMGDIKLVIVSLLLMTVFCTLTLAKFRNPVFGHFCLGNGGLLALTLGIGAAFGLVMLTGSPYVAFAGVLPFLVLGVGIDNIFIIVDCLDRQESKVMGSERIAKTMGHVGSSITMTTLTDLVAFSVSMVTDFPAIKYFCFYAAMSITICYLLVITLFLAFLTYDVKRIETGRKDILLCAKGESQTSWDDRGESIFSKAMEILGCYLMKAPIKWSLFLGSLGLLVGGVYGAMHIDQSFDMLTLGLEGSAYVEYYSYRNYAFPQGFSISVIVDVPLNYTDSLIQQEYAKLSDIPINNHFLKDKYSNWMKEYMNWSQRQGVSIEGFGFYLHLTSFLEKHKRFYRDIKFERHANHSVSISVSRMWLYSVDNQNSVFRKDMMLALRDDLKKAKVLQAYATHIMFIYIEQFVIILRDTIRNLVICAFAILLITLPYLKQPVITMLVFWGFVSLIFELLAMMYLWNVSLNSISMIIIVMAIGFAVDYSAHVAHAFVISKAPTPEKRAVDAIATMGSSVLMGGTSTFIGVIVTAFATSEIFKIFFKMVFGIVTLGLLHGLIFLPVLMSIFCRTDLREYANKIKANERDGELHDIADNNETA